MELFLTRCYIILFVKPTLCQLVLYKSTLTFKILRGFLDVLHAIIELQVNIHLVDDPNGQFTTTRDNNEITRIFQEVNRIWEAAQIRFVLNNIQRHTIANNEMIQLYDLGRNEIPTGNKKFFDTYYVKNFNNIGKTWNGFARPELGRTFIRDNTLVHDFRCTAHEFGHVLRINHVPQAERLMAEGKNGELLLDWEIRIARHMARL